MQIAMKFIKRLQKMEATTQILLSFLGVIIIGTILLCLPISNKQYSIGFLNNLFIATSATCVTGLSPITVADTYSFFGQVVLLILIQIGGLGFITLFMFFMTTFSSRMSIKNKGLVAEALSLETNFDTAHIIRAILFYTFLFEGIGAILLALRFIPEYGPADGIFKAIFISISSFCNAGFDNLGSNSLGYFVKDPIVNFTVCALVILGGIGFTVWFEIGRKTKAIIKKEISLKKAITKTNLHTRIVLSFTGMLLVIGTLITLVFEWNNPDTLGNLPFLNRIMAAFFTSTTLRTAGFATVDFSLLRPGLQFVMLIFMLIGGSPGGTAGGVKTTTTAAIIFASIAYLKGTHHIRVHNKELGNEVLPRAIAIFAMAVSILFVAIVLLLQSESSLNFMEIVFEAVSAFATVGLSLNVTSRLTSLGKIVIIVLMYCGRVGVLTLGVTFMKRGSDAHVVNEIQYPHENILIG